MQFSLLLAMTNLRQKTYKSHNVDFSLPAKFFHTREQGIKLSITDLKKPKYLLFELIYWWSTCTNLN
jgi:hypothetical protein